MKCAMALSANACRALMAREAIIVATVLALSVKPFRNVYSTAVPMNRKRITSPEVEIGILNVLAASLPAVRARHGGWLATATDPRLTAARFRAAQRAHKPPDACARRSTAHCSGL